MRTLIVALLYRLLLTKKPNPNSATPCLALWASQDMASGHTLEGAGFPSLGFRGSLSVSLGQKVLQGPKFRV